MRKELRYEFRLTFLLYPSEDSPGRHVAHCLELDVLAVEDSIAKAIILLKELIEEHILSAIKDDALEKIFKPAPEKYWQRLIHSKRYIPTKKVAEHRIEAPQMPIKKVDYASFDLAAIP